MKKLLFLILFSSVCFNAFSQKLPEILSVEDFAIGKTIKINSAVLNETRILNIYLPFKYEEHSDKKYPVIYLLDGSADEDFIHISGIVQFGSFPWINSIPESIVVGISNIDRKKDFTYPSENELDQKDFPTSGGSEKFIQFIAMELQPFINDNFNTNSSKTLIGQSLGGLLATEILLKKPELFDNYIIVSPSLWWDDEKLLQSVPPKFNSPKSIYIAVGKEGEIMERLAKELYTKIKTINNPYIKSKFEFLEQKSHGDALHQAAYNALEWINKKTNN